MCARGHLGVILSALLLLLAVPTGSAIASKKAVRGTGQTNGKGLRSNKARPVVKNERRGKFNAKDSVRAAISGLSAAGRRMRFGRSRSSLHRNIKWAKRLAPRRAKDNTRLTFAENVETLDGSFHDVSTARIYGDVGYLELTSSIVDGPYPDLVRTETIQLMRAYTDDAAITVTMHRDGTETFATRDEVDGEFVERSFDEALAWMRSVPEQALRRKARQPASSEAMNGARAQLRQMLDEGLGTFKPLDKTIGKTLWKVMPRGLKKQRGYRLVTGELNVGAP